MSEQHSSGMTMVELAFVVCIAGLLIGVSVPYFLGYRRSHELRGAALNIASQMRLARATAIMTGRTQRFHFYESYMGYDYHIHDGNGPIKTGWKLPDGVSYTWGGPLIAVDLERDGRASTALDIILVGNTGRRDTVSIQKSGFILAQ